MTLPPVFGFRIWVLACIGFRWGVAGVPPAEGVAEKKIGLARFSLERGGDFPPYKLLILKTLILMF